MVNEINSIDILAIGVHPDDVELTSAGTLLKHKSLGYSFGILDLTLGELGTRGSAEIRTQEAMAAARYMGAQFRIQLNLADGFFQHNEESLMQIIPIIRACKPRIVMANALEDRHPDHGRAAKLIADACFLAGLRKIFSTWDNKVQEAHRPDVIYHYVQDYTLKPDLIVDITGFEEEKMNAIKHFASQFYDPNSDEPESAISGKNFLDYIKSKDAINGRYISTEYGEAYNVRRPIGVSDFFNLK
ncbi:MAG: bacillithiol biosynthesis deacetylase BshB1 [Saprospiraceae bacterium]|nr:bacillithiol biosynthesis deacetylase BshB1 [Saprospiraceae bacterium]